MTLQIHPVTEIDPRELRTLVLDNLGKLLGEGTNHLDNIPDIDERCLTATDPDGNTLLLSFDALDPERALLGGLNRMDLLDSDVAALFVQGYSPPARLLVLTPEPPPGMSLFDGRCAIDWLRLQVLSVNGELGLLLDTQAADTTARPSNVETIPFEPRSGSTEEPVLSTEEEEHFKQL
ncbi:MAG: hypothetical protein WBO06_05635 [Gammaproteobacteria bacterium]